MSGSKSPGPKEKKKRRDRGVFTRRRKVCVGPVLKLSSGWRKDAAGNVVCKRFFNCRGCLCFEYDQIVPFSKGGESVAENCQILQTRVNRFKSDKKMELIQMN